MLKFSFNKTVLLAAFALFSVAQNASAGFTLAIKSVAVSQPVAADTSPKTRNPVPVEDVVDNQSSYLLTVNPGDSVERQVSTFLSANGWQVAWNARPLIATQKLTFEGKTFELTLSQLLRHYKLRGERFETERGYVIHDQ